MVDRYNARGIFRNSTSNGCNSCNTQQSCGCTDKSDCRKLLERLQEVDFSLIDTVLYLDAYPHCSEALCYYHKLKKEREELVHTLAYSCNMPITSYNNASETEWSWTDSPWPWEPCAN